MNARDFLKALRGEAPLFPSITVTQSLDVSLGDTDAVTVQGQAAMRGQASGGA